MENVVASEGPIRVQTLVKSGVAKVPNQYVQSPEHRPASVREAGSNGGGIPVVDLHDFEVGQRNQVVEEVGRACREWGAFQVRNHGVSKKLLEEMKRVGRYFFEECSMEEKVKYSCDPKSPASEGYGTRMLVKEDSVLDWRDYFDHHTLPLSRRNPSRWPQFPPNYRGVVEEYSDKMKLLAMKLLSVISESVGLPALCIEEIIGDIYQNITISYYPPCPQPELTLGLQSHSDFGALTLLIQDEVGGLEVFKDNHWVTVQPLSDAIVVILADQTEIITNGLYKSSQHRAVTNSDQARLSVATFHDPAKTRKISPAAGLLSKDFPAKYREAVYGEHVKSWYTKGPEGKKNIDALLI